ncbi:5' nucleotidase, NT5C type [Salegentibacter mishustinae]|jgi:5'(3')-deoxyribonucleotidase|uniref:5' nucleotidase, NT5C type n=1 Tax=Salegentibacter mishustinae TaxID=270918 RepID=UPI0024936222|nr:5'(3')-deoxyribonucleotidase [Salegentibacter mishustinae]MDX1428019.1 5'(3')-deoxyribonucleotidase [Salegentibacter mishustinae]MDX1720340.1 5'(3')-deoxyribonucleotidase [Salegentibacter mishustinae]
MKKSIAIDMDGVLADVEAHFITWYEKEYGERFSKNDLKGKTEENAFPKKGMVKKFASTKGFFSTVPVMDGAVEAIKELQKNYEVYIVSAAMEFPQSLVEKRSWLSEHFPFIHWKNIIFCGDKSVIGTDIMIDDHLKNLDYFKGETIMFTAFHNIDFDNHTRANNWREVLKILKSLEKF